MTLRIKVPQKPGLFPLLALGERSNLRCGVVLRSDLKRNEPDLAPQSDQWPGSLDFTQEKKAGTETSYFSFSRQHDHHCAHGPCSQQHLGTERSFLPILRSLAFLKESTRWRPSKR